MTRKNISEVIIGILAIASIVLVAIESLVPVSRSTLLGIYIADLIICIIFAGDFIQRLRASEGKARFMKINGYEIIAMIPAMALFALGGIPALSTAFRSLRLIRVVRVIIVMARMRRVMSKSGGFLARSHLLATLGIAVSVIFLGAFAVLLLERGLPEAQITNFSDAVWWSISTVTTVGYGDIVPHSIAGRIMGMALMVVGIGVMAAFISEISATLVQSRLSQPAGGDDLRSSLIAEIKKKIDRIETLSESEAALLTEMIRTLRLNKGNQPPTG